MKHDENTVSEISYRAKERLEFHCARSMSALLDSDLTKRQKAQECKCCFYLSSGLAGQAFTEWTCAVCGAKDCWANTATPRVCKDCATKHALCVRCGGDIHMRSRRKATLNEEVNK